MRLPNQSASVTRYSVYSATGVIRNRAAITRVVSVGATPSQYTTGLRRLPVLTLDRTRQAPVYLDLSLVALGPDIEWGCKGLHCECRGGANSPQCQIVAPYCADFLTCLGDDCFCTWGGGP